MKLEKRWGSQRGRDAGVLSQVAGATEKKALLPTLVRLCEKMERKMANAKAVRRSSIGRERGHDVSCCMLEQIHRGF